MQFEKINNIVKLVDRLKSDLVFRHYCGFKAFASVLSTSTFCRFLTAISDSNAIEEDFKQLISIAKNCNKVDDADIAIDATKLNAF